jgi:hypothetical protein
MPGKLIRTAAAVELERAFLNKDGEALASVLAFYITNYRVRLEEDHVELIAAAARAVRTPEARE